MPVKTMLIFLILALIGCSNTGVVGYIDDHPNFSPIVKRNNKFEYQIIWRRSWKPTIYLKAYIEQDIWGKQVQSYISYSSSETSVANLTSYKISTDEWQSIVKAVDESTIWTYDSKCDQLAYKERSIYFNDDTGGCEEILMMDGASISVAISEPERDIGVYSVCNDLGPCEPFGFLARAILKTIGKENLAN
jgi:hypothetical protein